MVVLTVYMNNREHSWKHVVLKKPHGMHESVQQLSVVVADIDRVRRREGTCNVLVFGPPTYADFWMQHNPGGRTVFLDNDMGRIERMRKRNSNITAFPVTYHTQVRRDMDKFADKADWASLNMQLDPSVRNAVWHVIIVNGPEGFCATCPGRFQPLYMSSVLTRPPDALTVVNDCQRDLEATFAPRFLGADAIVMAIPRKRYAGLVRTVQCYFRPNMAPKT